MAPRDDLFQIGTHMDRIHECERHWRGHALPTATPQGERYPLVYPRDTAVILRALDRLAHKRAIAEKDAAAALHGAAAFLIEAQGPDGRWGQRYDLDAKDCSIYPQEDNTAHALAAIARHVRHERRQGRASPIEARALDALRRGTEGARSADLREETGLYFSNTSVHESALERGFTLWTNGAFHEALRLAAEAARAAGRDEDARAWDAQREALRAAMRERLVHEGRFVRARGPSGKPDLRPDITLLSPHYFGFDDLDRRAEENAVAFLEEELCDPETGLLRRYHPDHEDMAIHLHGGDGPYCSFSGWLAQRCAARGETERARDLLARIARCATREGSLPEHVATMEKFGGFLQTEVLSGIDLRKEFDPDILLPDVGYEPVLAEAARMMSAYHHAVQAAEAMGDGLVRLATPHAWTHAEFALALAMCDEAE